MTDLNQPANTGNWLEEPKKIPSMLNVLTILTFIGNGLGIITSFYSYFSAASNYDKMVQAQSQIDQMPDIVKNMMGADPVGMARRVLDNRLPIMLLDLVGCLLCFYGAFQMRKLKKAGFTLYLVGDVLPFIALFVFVGMSAVTGFTGIFSLIITIVFVILYATQLKYLK